MLCSCRSGHAGRTEVKAEGGQVFCAASVVGMRSRSHSAGTWLLIDQTAVLQGSPR